MKSGNKITLCGDFHIVIVVIPAAVKFIDMSPDCLDMTGKLLFQFLLIVGIHITEKCVEGDLRINYLPSVITGMNFVHFTVTQNLM